MAPKQKEFIVEGRFFRQPGQGFGGYFLNMIPTAWGLLKFFFQRLKYTKLNRIKVSPYGFELGLSVSVNYINLRKVNKFRPDFSLDLIDTWPEFLASSTFFWRPDPFRFEF